MTSPTPNKWRTDHFTDTWDDTPLDGYDPSPSTQPRWTGACAAAHAAGQPCACRNEPWAQPPATSPAAVAS